MQPHAVGNPRRGLRHQRPHRRQRDRHHRQSQLPRREFRRHQREVVVFATKIEFLAGFPAAEDRPQRLHVFAHARGRRHPGHGKPPLVMRLHLAAEPQNEASPGMSLQIPRVIGNDHRTARKCDRHRGRQLHALRRQRGEGQRGERLVPQFVGSDAVEPVFLRLTRGRTARRPVRHRQSYRNAHRRPPLTRSQCAVRRLAGQRVAGRAAVRRLTDKPGQEVLTVSGILIILIAKFAETQSSQRRIY